MQDMENSRMRLLLLILVMCFSISCEKNVDTTGFFTPEMFSIATFLEENSEEYSMYYQLMQHTNLYYTLNAYNPHGSGYTLFLPSDEAFLRFIASSDEYSSFEELLGDIEFSYTLSRYHIVNKSVMTSEFSFGALPDSTATGDYLTISIDVMSDTTVYRVNNTAPILQQDIETIIVTGDSDAMSWYLHL